jgi:hypothetical protein
MAQAKSHDGMVNAARALKQIEGKVITRAETIRPADAHPQDSPWGLILHLNDSTTLEIRSYLSPALCSRPPVLEIDRK